MEENNSPLADQLKAIADNNPVRFHMPGHKGMVQKFDSVLNTSISTDFTELPGTDNLYTPSSVILEAENRAAEAFGSAHTLFCAGGATLCLQTCVLFSVLLSRKTERPLFCDRLCHMSVMNALILSDCDPIWFFPEDNALFAKIKAEKPCALILTSPDYYGSFRLTKHLIDVCHSVGCIVICDNSHGTHLAFYKNGVNHPLKMGADLVIDSAHKTLPSLTGAAFLHIASSLSEKRGELLQNMRLFGSSSPSYLILSSLDSARAYMQANGEKQLELLHSYILKTRAQLQKLGFTFESEEKSDIFRLTIGCSCIKIDGRKLYDFLCSKNILCEFADRTRLICICTVADEEKMYDQLTAAITEYTKEEHAAVFPIDLPARLPEKVLSLRQARFSTSEEVQLSCANGKISAESYAPYPPGIPVIVPGELFDDTVISALKEHFLRVKIIRE